MKKPAYIKPSCRITAVAPLQMVCTSGGIEEESITVHEDVTTTDVW